MREMDKLTRAIEYTKSGDKAKARQLLTELIRDEPNNESAWLWMSGVVEKPDRQIYCLQQALRINPNNQHASMGLAKLTSQNSQFAGSGRQVPGVKELVEMNPSARSADQAQPLPEISQWSNGFRGWGILNKVTDAQKNSPKMGVFIAESRVAENRIFGWAALFILLAALFGFLATLEFGNPLVLTAIALSFLAAALYRLTTWYLNRDLKVEIFREGFILRKSGQEHPISWPEIEYVKEKWQKTVYQGIIHIYRHKIEIHGSNGITLEMDRSFEKIEEIGRLIQLAVADSLLPVSIKRLENNEDCDFGAFTISRAGINHKGNKFLPWNKVKSIDVHTMGQTTLKVQESNGGKWGGAWATENGGAIKNLNLFLSLSLWFINVARQPLTDSSNASQGVDNGDVHYRLLIPKREAQDGTQKIFYVGTSLQERELVVKIPAGTQPGTTYRFPDYGRPNTENGNSGTLTVEILVEKVTPLQKRLQELQIFAGILILMGGMIWLTTWSTLDLLSSIILSIVIGGIGGFLISTQQRLVGLLSGAIGGAICFVLQFIYFIFMYIAFGRENFWNYEMVFVLLISALPGIGIYKLLQKLTEKRQLQPE
jgi:hypothetical protein